MNSSIFTLFLSLFMVILCVSSGVSEGKKMKHDEGRGRPEGKLKMMFYHKSCPRAEDTVKDIIWRKVEANPNLPPKLLRLHYHDCFVRGCDASLLLDPVAGKAAEKDARPNLSVSGFDIIDEIKSELEEQCPQTVSCADIVALAARDAVSYPFGRPLWNVFTGRKDGRVSIAAEAERDLPSAGSNFTTLRNLFAEVGLDVVDLVALSGAHTIGEAHCVVFQKRLFNFTGKGDTDPSLDQTYAAFLKSKCSSSSTGTSRVNSSATVGMDPISPHTFDSGYFKGLYQHKGLFTSDAALLTDPDAASFAGAFQNPDAFLAHFRHSMTKMGAIKVLTEDDDDGGEVRRNCRAIN